MFGIKTGVKFLDKTNVAIDPISIIPIRVEVPNDKGIIGSALNQIDRINGIPRTVLSTPEAIKDAADAAKAAATAAETAAKHGTETADKARTFFEQLTATVHSAEQHMHEVFMSLKAAMGGFAFHLIVGLVIVILALVAGYLIAKIYRTLRPVSA